MKISRLFPLAGALVLTFTLSNCFKDFDPGTTTPTNPAGSELSFEITDSPMEDANVSGVFVTVTGIKVNGETISNFSGKTTIDLMAYQNGKVKTLGGAELPTNTYDDVRLVIDYNTDAAGETPGTYVLMKNGDKKALKNSTNGSTEIVLNTSIDFDEDVDKTVVIDFDLRKAIRYSGSGSTSSYEFVTASELNEAVRVVEKKQTGTIKGTLSDDFTLPNSKVVVYAYTKGEYTDLEKGPQGTSGVRFKNAVSSALVDEDGKFTFAFMKEGHYELHFINYGDNDEDGKFEEKRVLLLELAGTLDLNDIEVESSATVDLDVTVIGIVPL